MIALAAMRLLRDKLGLGQLDVIWLPPGPAEVVVKRPDP